MWNVLNGSYDEFMPLYKDGANDIYFTGQETIPSEKEDIYYCCPVKLFQTK